MSVHKIPVGKDYMKKSLKIKYPGEELHFTPKYRLLLVDSTAS